MNLNDISGIIVDEAYKLHADLGPGLLETVYEVLLCHRLERRGLRVRRQVSVPIRYDGIEFEEGFRADLVVEEAIIVELKSVEQNLPVHGKQLLTHLRLADKRLGLLINFGRVLFKDGLKRVANHLPAADSLPGAVRPE